MSFLAPKPDTPSTSAERQSYSASGPVPVGFGRFRVGMKLIESPWNHWQSDHGDKRAKGNIYSIAAVGCHGPIRSIERLWINGKPLSQHAYVRSGSEMYRDDTYAYGGGGAAWKLRIYWGDENQSADPFLTGTPVAVPHGPTPAQPPKNPDGSFRMHPPYAGLFYIIFYYLWFDYPTGNYGQTSLPSIEAEVTMAPPSDTSSDTILEQHGANPILAARAMLTHPIYGADLPDAMAPQTEWLAAANALTSEGYHHQTAGAGNLSPVWGSNIGLDQLLSDLFGYYDGFLKIKNGVLTPGYFPNQAYDPGTLTTLTEDDLIEDAEIDPGGWDDTLSEVTIKYRSNALLEEVAITERSTYNLNVTGRGSKKNIDAPFVIHPQQARSMAQREIAIRSQPEFSARLKVLRGRAINPDGSPLMPGDMVHLNYAPNALQLLCRIIEREDRASEVSLLITNERGRFAEDYIPAPEPRQIPAILSAETITDWRLLELPDSLAGGSWPPKLIAIAARPNASILSAHTFLSQIGDYTGEEQEIAPITAFAAFGSIAPASLTESATEIEFQITTPEPNLTLYRDFTAAELADGYMLILIGSELISLGSIVSQFNGWWTFNCQRGFAGTPITAHDGNTSLFLFRKSWLPQMAISHQLLNDSSYDAPPTLYIRLASATGLEAGTPNAPTSITLRARTPEEVVTATATYDKGDGKITIEWETPADNSISTIRIEENIHGAGWVLAYESLSSPSNASKWIRTGVYEGATDVIYQYRVITVNKYNVASSPKSADPSIITVRSVKTPFVTLTILAADYLKYTVSWLSASIQAEEQDYIVIQRWPASGNGDPQNSQTKLVWAQATLNEYQENVDFIGWIGIRAWYVRVYENGRQQWSAPSETIWGAINSDLAPSSVEAVDGVGKANVSWEDEAQPYVYVGLFTYVDGVNDTYINHRYVPSYMGNTTLPWSSGGTGFVVKLRRARNVNGEYITGDYVNSAQFNITPI